MARMEEDAVFSNLRDKLFTAVVGDVLDKMGWRRQFLPQAIATAQTGHEVCRPRHARPRGRHF